MKKNKKRNEAPKNDAINVDTFERDPSAENEAIHESNQTQDSSMEDVDEELEENPKQALSPENDFETRENELLQRIAELERGIAESQDKMLRRAAEFENMKRRLERDRSQIFAQARQDSVTAFLDIYEDLLRTIEATEKTELPEQFKQGVSLIGEKFAKALDSFSISVINEPNVPFDVDLHDALMRQPAADKETGSNMVLQVLSPGYKIGDQVIRHAKVIVSQ